VLDAERAAEEAVAEAEAEAERLLSDARDRARRIGERADERIRRVHGRSATLADQAIEQLYEAHEDRARESQRNLSNPDLAQAAAARVAAWLLGEDEA
jgi:vacuolar-type H+-ATPase subunit H